MITSFLSHQNMKTDILKTQKWLNAATIKGTKAFRSEQMQP